LSFREIGAMLGIREDAAKLRSSRGMADLRAELVAKGAGRKGRND
jgi:DNA-directed RNA polymerase specialized sigma24 family protein